LWFVFVGPNFVVLSFGHVPASRNLAECLNGHSRSPSAPDPNKSHTPYHAYASLEPAFGRYLSAVLLWLGRCI
ncbi:hypothetical protein B0H10DRAFT_2012007, partial [Mycena sp. CBHHK59/15]